MLATFYIAHNVAIRDRHQPVRGLNPPPLSPSNPGKSNTGYDLWVRSKKTRSLDIH